MRDRSLTVAALLMVFSSAFAEELHTVTITAHPPAGTEKLFITGNRPEIGNWNPGVHAMKKEGDAFVTTLAIPHGTLLEFKFTLGSWAHEALMPDGSIPGNHRVEVDGDKSVEYRVERFRDAGPPPLPTAEGSGVLGTLIYHHDVASKHLRFPRHVAVWLPPGYEKDASHRYPVLYMHDGQNLFDPRIANTGVDWGVDEAVVRLVEAKKIPPIIVVGIFSTPGRIVEYNPLAEGESYAKFLIEELKPMVDAKYRTHPEAKYTGVMGSSAGGLISIGLGWKHPEVFTRIGALSAHLPPIPAQFRGTGESILDKIESAGPLDQSLRLYIDRSGLDIDATYPPYHERFRQLLTGWGWKEGENLLVRDFPNTRHTEADWRKRLDIPLEFLFADLKNP